MDPLQHDRSACQGIGTGLQTENAGGCRSCAVGPKNCTPEQCEDERASLIRAIESEVIPRLMLLQAENRGSWPAAASDTSGEAAPPSFPSIAQFAEIAMSGDHGLASDYVEAMRAHGASLEKVCLDLLGPAARHMGEMWVRDECNFAEVTLGLCRLQHLLRDNCDRLPGESDAGDLRGLRALLAPVPGEQHTLGLAMVMEFFRRAGWDVDGGPGIGLDELRAMVAKDWFHIVGFSASDAFHFPALTRCIRAVRKASLNPRIGIMVGGRAFTSHPDVAMQVGADATCEYGNEAPIQAERLLAVMARAQR
jgi:MerR family transcriptional regulator, light-induced transcriptional regulator